eukprot:1489064-Pyramimonas_sp.AAC.1
MVQGCSGVVALRIDLMGRGGVVQKWFKSGSEVVQKRFKSGSGMVQEWLKSGSGMVREWFGCCKTGSEVVA